MTPRDTSKEYVERMCRCAPFADNEAGIPEMVAMLRALLARAEAAEAELAVEQEARELASESDAGWEQVANAAQAEAARLRRGWLATIQTENSCPATGGGCLSKRCGCLEEMEMLMREDDARAALTVEARDE